MTAHPRQLARSFAPLAKPRFQNLLVSGCSFTYNDSDQHICSWPYYMRDLGGFSQVLDCSQSGAGNNHVFNSVVNEIETNPAVAADNTVVIVMWSGLTRTDVIATPDITRKWHSESNYHFNNWFSTFSIFNRPQGSGYRALEELCQLYKRTVSVDAQVYESLIKMIALRAYLDQRGFESVALSWKDPALEYHNRNIDQCIIDSAVQTLDTTVEYLDSYAQRHCEQAPDGHPTGAGYLGWTRNCLLPAMQARGLVTPISCVP